MSRVGKYPVEVPAGVQLAMAGRTLTATGKLGELSLVVRDNVTVTVADNKVSVAPNGGERTARMMWGTTRALVANMVKGVSTGYSKTMEIQGTGFRAAVTGPNLVINLGLQP